MTHAAPRAVLLSACRTPIGSFGGALGDLTAVVHAVEAVRCGCTARRGGGLGVAALCIGGGMGIAEVVRVG